MFPRKLTSAAETSLKTMGQTSYEYEISDSGYGKDHVKILHVRRDGTVHHIKEFEVNTHLKLYSKKDYMYGEYSTAAVPPYLPEESFAISFSFLSHLLVRYDVIVHMYRRMRKTCVGKRWMDWGGKQFLPNRFCLWSFQANCSSAMPRVSFLTVYLPSINTRAACSIQ